MNYGMPYKGSKNLIAEKLMRLLPPAKHFYDLFGGGGAMSHCALLSGKYKVVHYNELNPLVFRGFQMFINGEFKTENRWISREEFFKLKNTDPYVAICFSFGNNLRTYFCNVETEAFKKAVHYSIYFDDNSLLSEYEDLSGFKYLSNNFKERRLQLQRYFSVLFKQNKLNPVILNYVSSSNNIIRAVSQNNQNLERLNEYDAGNDIILTNQSYSDVKIEPDSVIYCDPPYLGTEQYRNQFSTEKFYTWLKESKSLIYVSEYQMPPDFTEVLAVQKQCRLNNKVPKKTVEKLYCNRADFHPSGFLF